MKRIFSSLLILLQFGFLCPFAYGGSEEIRPHGSDHYQMLTGDDSEDDRGHWDAFFNTFTYVFGKEPAVFIKDNIAMLPSPKGARALDIAMSEGRNAVFLAKQGYLVDGVDYSEVAIRKAKKLARDNGVSINTINADLNTYIIKADSYNLIVNINYLQRSLIPRIKSGLKKGGIVVYETWTVDQQKNVRDQQMRRDYLLEKGELKELFKEFQILLFRETNNGKDALASLIARKL